jgi:cytochrome b
MPLSMLFWVLFVIWILFGGYAHYDGTALRWRPFGGHLLLGLLIFLLAWGTFGFVVTGGR